MTETAGHPPGEETPPPLPQEILERDYPTSANREPRRSGEKVTTSSNFPRGRPSMACDSTRKWPHNSESSYSHKPALVRQRSCRLCLPCLATAEMRMNLRQRLRLPLQNSIHTWPCVCSTTSHAPALSSHQLLTCANEGMLGQRHGDLRPAHALRHGHNSRPHR